MLDVYGFIAIKIALSPQFSAPSRHSFIIRAAPAEFFMNGRQGFAVYATRSPAVSSACGVSISRRDDGVSISRWVIATTVVAARCLASTA